MTPGAAERVDKLLEAGKIRGYADLFRTLEGTQEYAFVSAEQPDVIQVRRNHEILGNVFFAPKLGWELIHESQHVVQFAAYPTLRARQQALKQHRGTWQRAADAYATANYTCEQPEGKRK